MNHLKELNTISGETDVLKVKLTGRYYTPSELAQIGIENLLNEIKLRGDFTEPLRIIDPFGGDGRLIYWFLKAWKKNELPSITFEIFLWDLEDVGFSEAKKHFKELENLGLNFILNLRQVDSFKAGLDFFNSFDIVLTNPPWELLKPDRRELKVLNENSQSKYIESLREFDSFITENYPISQPNKKFAGWGTNLSRVGLELSFNLLRKKSFCLIVLPATFFADQQSTRLRELIYKKSNISYISYFPPEARLFGSADTSSSILIFDKAESITNHNQNIELKVYNKDLKIENKGVLNLDFMSLKENDFLIPIGLGLKGMSLFEKLKNSFSSWSEIETNEVNCFWAGRELDETRSNEWLSDTEGTNKFIKGRMIQRYTIVEEPRLFVNKENWIPPKSVNYERIVWRDVSRTNQKRRIVATIIPKNVVAGNSLGVCYFNDSNTKSLYFLLGIFNSFCFEFQLRSYLATGHVSLSSLRKVSMPNRAEYNKHQLLSQLVETVLEGNIENENKIEAYVARYIYRLSKPEFINLLSYFKKHNKEEINDILGEYDNISIEKNKLKDTINVLGTVIPNHLSGSLSALDLRIVNSVPPGGNWKNIPEDVPSKRVQTIRESYARGEGSRSTYYGRLLPEMPSYTINTYFSRPGNGCHIHYSQNRVISQREAARLQSFPDNFIFHGSQTSVNTQIGNAVPPLLAYQLAKRIEESIGQKGVYIDLFSGAGGMGLGFKLAGWTPILANDIDKNFLKTYANNVHSETICGSISDPEIFKEIVKRARELKKEFKGKPFWVLGGPPCQGFSTAGKKRTMEDERNHLFYNYVEFLEKVKPDGFVFENVSGLLNMKKGEVFEMVKNEFSKTMKNIEGFVLSTENYAIPQRRKRVILIGSKSLKTKIAPPKVLTSLNKKKDLFTTYAKSIGVEEALSDLPELSPSQNGSSLNYLDIELSNYQKLMRGIIDVKEYLDNY